MAPLWASVTLLSLASCATCSSAQFVYSFSSYYKNAARVRRDNEAAEMVMRALAGTDSAKADMAQGVVTSNFKSAPDKAEAPKGNEGTIEVVVTSDGDPAAGVHVTVATEPMLIYTGDATTNSKGKAVVNVPEGQYSVEVDVPAHVDIESGPAKGDFKAVAVRKGETMKLSLALREITTNATLMLTIRDIDGKPVPENTRIDIISITGKTVQSLSTPSDDGKLLVNLPPGTYTVRLNDTNYVTQSHNATVVVDYPNTEGGPDNENSAVVVVVEAASTGSISGTLYFDRNGNEEANDGEGLAGVEVNLRSSTDPTVGVTKTTDIKGQYMFDRLVSGNYTVAFGAIPGFAIPSTLERSTDVVLAVKGKQTFSLRIPQTGTVSGVIYEDANFNKEVDKGEGRSEFTVQLVDQIGVVAASTTTQASGVFTIENVVAGDNYILRVADKNGNAEQENVKVEPNAASNVEFCFNACCYAPYESLKDGSWERFDMYGL